MNICVASLHSGGRSMCARIVESRRPPYLAWIDLLTTECVVEGTHIGDVLRNLQTRVRSCADYFLDDALRQAIMVGHVLL